MKRTLTRVDCFASFWRLVCFRVLSCCVLLALAAEVTAAPSITSQPTAMQADYGSNVMFSVSATGGAALTFQWRKDGVDLADYENVVGAQTPSLKLVGVAQADAGDYSVLISGKNGSVVSSTARLSVGAVLVFQDDFEQALTNWVALDGAIGLTASATNHTANGHGSAGLTNALQHVYHNLDTKMTGRVKLTFWMYDDDQSLTYGELRGHTGPGYAKYSASGGWTQILALGKFATSITTNKAGDPVGEVLDGSSYQCRVVRGAKIGWFNLNAAGAPKRSRGWHKFLIDRSADGSTVDFYVDDVLGRTVTGAISGALDCVMIGSLGLTNGVGTAGINPAGRAWFDDVKVEVYPETFDWQALASDGAFSDVMKLKETGTSTQVVGVRRLDTVAEAKGMAVRTSVGKWVSEGQAVVADGMRGYVEYALTAPGDDAYRIEIEGREHDFRTPAVGLPLDVYLDGEFLGRFNLTYGARSNGVLHCFSPFIKAGAHTLGLNWDNAGRERRLRVHAVRLQAIDAGTTRAGGKKGWVANRLATQCGVEVAPAANVASPVCVEGRGQYLSMLSLAAGAEYPLTPVPVHPGAGYHWYANVPLVAGAVTRVETSFQNGGLVQTNDLTWQPTDLSNGGSVTIREGDSLLFTMAASGSASDSVVVKVNGAIAYTTNAAALVPYQFGQPGDFVVAGSLAGGKAAGRLKVTVVAIQPENVVAARVNRSRFLAFTNLPAEAVLDADPRLRSAALSTEELQEAATNSPLNKWECRIWAHSTEARHVLTRLGVGGPVLGDTLVTGFRWFTSPDTYLRITKVNDDGSQLIETAMIMSPVLPNVTATVQIIVSGVTFEDGSLVKNLSAADFDNLGVCKVRFIRGANVKTSVCHVTKLYDNGSLISWK